MLMTLRCISRPTKLLHAPLVVLPPLMAVSLVLFSVRCLAILQTLQFPLYELQRLHHIGIAVNCGAMTVLILVQETTSFPVSLELTAIHYLYSMPRGYRSRQRDTHEIMLSVLYLGLGSRVWLQHCIILNSVAEVLCQKG